MKTIAFRVKTPKGPVQISNLTDQDRILDLKTALIGLTGINRLKVMHGYPPKELDLNKEDVRLGTLFKTLRESLIVSEKDVSTSMKEANPQHTSANVPKDRNTQVISSSVSAKGFLNKSTGKLLRKVIPANNSCLFTAVYFCISNGIFEPKIGYDLRKIIVRKVKDDPIQFNDAILDMLLLTSSYCIDLIIPCPSGCPVEEYCAKILRDDVWGGSIELKILSDYYAIEIVAVDTQNVRLNRFGEDKNYKSMIFLIYDGIHYDSLYLEKPGQTKPITVFPTNSPDSRGLLAMALEMAKEAKSKGQFTDVKNFSLKCLACNDCFTGSEEANLHAKKTGHINFGEF